MTTKKRREYLAAWLFEMYFRACRDEKSAVESNQPKEAQRLRKVAREISNLLARMSRSEYPITR